MPIRSDSYLPPGTRVCREDDGWAEYGIVVHCWHCNEIEAFDCHVAFYGDVLPDGKPTKQPYVLRYASVSLTVLD